MKHAIFLIGGPGSGKDIILKEVFSKYDYVEFAVEQVKNVVKKFFREVIVITGNAYSPEKIIEAKQLLDTAGYSSSIIYVDVSDSISRDRLANRGISEQTRIDRLIDSKVNMEVYEDLFDDFYYFNNVFEQNSLDTELQLKTLEEDLQGGCALSDKRTAALKARISSIRRADSLQHSRVVDENAAKHLTKSKTNVFSFHNKKSEVARKSILDFKDRLKHESYNIFCNLDEAKKKSSNGENSQTTTMNPIRGSGLGPEFDLRSAGVYRLGGVSTVMATEGMDSPLSDSGFPGVEGSSSNKMGIEKNNSYEYKLDNKKLSTINKAKGIISKKYNTNVKKLSILKK